MINENTDKDISIIIPCRNEEKFIGMCLDSLIAQDYPFDLIEILVVDGMSTDRTREIILDYGTKYQNIGLLDNPAYTVPHAMNIGIKAAKGKFIIRADAHALYDSDYVRKCVELLKERKAENVGGCQNAKGTDYWSSAIALATTYPFGVGNAYFRFSNKERYVDTVYLGAWKKETLERLGGFNEKWIVNQDYELNYRLRAAGGRILLSPEIKCTYFVRPSLLKLIKQYFRYGEWKVKTIKEHPESLVWRQIVPPLFVLSLIISIVLSFYYLWLGFLVPGVYLATNIIASLLLAIKRGRRYFPALPIVFTCMHLSWSLGFWFGVFNEGLFKRQKENLSKFLKVQQ